MSNHIVLAFAREHREELQKEWTDIFRRLGEKETDMMLNDNMYETICSEYVQLIITSLSEGYAEDFEEKVQTFALKIVQMGISLKLLANGLTEIRTHLYQKMNDDKNTTEESHDLIWQIDRFITPIHNEILNQYSISWEKTVNLQKIALQELSAPLIPVFEHITVMPLVGTIDTERAKKIMENLLNGVVKHRSQVVLIDITGVPVVDTMVAHHIIQASEAVRLVGAKCLLVGIRPEIAQTIVNLGIDLSQVTTKNTLQKGIQTALEMTNRKIVSLEG
ncbi:RsbT co-antagonist protein RsbRA [Bacillus safensis]|uniref:RsbT co-antagonist protein RsbRA n=1 Tax=Bacillus TaxID=1386 RepID=UPI0009763EEA|nr:MULTISPECIES: RsbT co-antagonist protein RsbRA [Bacillus]MCA6609061.1 RsbT co-antagonist protein RsbRA [Bacillus safensis]MCU0157809.1 RsbT co-antagonist protein RsbRA [Bacillus safensis]MEC3737596.1 RsbT co-antagonist protein RsbRA [Bacillus safensis]OMP27125.1 RsbT co-antagonist protein RsbRA [Bacillus sp. I-2]WLW70046.1 RsbT co-antagonist protein RsbRA [Bacillus safensis]